MKTTLSLIIHDSPFGLFYLFIRDKVTTDLRDVQATCNIRISFLGRLESWKQFHYRRIQSLRFESARSAPNSKINSMEILLALSRKRKHRRDSDFKKASTRGGFPKEIFEIIRLKNKTVWNVIGIVYVQERRIFVSWERNGAAYICHERVAEFDLILKPRP